MFVYLWLEKNNLRLLNYSKTHRKELVDEYEKFAAEGVKNVTVKTD